MRALASCVVCAGLALASSGARAQSMVGALGDPNKCVVVIEEMGKVGFRISDAQIVAEAVMTSMRKRVGFDGVAYAGVASSAKAMKRLLATPEGAGPQEAQLAYYKACEQKAPWRVKARFGVKHHKQWITVACHKVDGADVEEKRFEAKTFLEARDALAAAMPAFCPAITPPVVGPSDIPNEAAAAKDATPIGVRKKEAPKAWTPPPRR